MTASDLFSDIIPSLTIPLPSLKLLDREGRLMVYDLLRKKYVSLSPEELVRQCFVAYLIDTLHYLPSHMANEVGLDLNGIKKRCDTLVFDKNGNPLLIIEYKAPGVQITQKVFNQIIGYSIPTKVEYLVITNGINHYCCHLGNNKDGNYEFIPEIPDYNSIG